MESKYLLASLAGLQDDDDYNNKINELVDDIIKTSGAWHEFSQQIKEEDATRLKEFLEGGPLFQMEIKALFGKVDGEKKGYVTYGEKTFKAFIDACIDHFKLPTPRGGELVYRKLFNRFRSEQKLNLQDCEDLVVTMAHVIIRSFGLTVANQAMGDIIKQIKESGAWEEFKKSLKDKGMDSTGVEAITEKLQSGELKKLFDDADESNRGELNWSKCEAYSFMKAALGFFGYPEPKGGEMIYFKMFKGFAKMNGATITYSECLRMIATCLSVALMDE